MASLLRLNPALLPPPSQPTTAATAVKIRFTVRCGPRDNRAPLSKGRVLSIEAIQAVQALKRAHRADPTNPNNVSRTLSRLIKSDLIAAFSELLRQDHCDLALQVFSAVRLEDWYKPDLSLYAKLVSALARKGFTEEIDRLISDLEGEGTGEIDLAYDRKGLLLLVKALIAAERGESTVRIYRMMKRSGWGCNSPEDDFLARVLCRGLRRLGEGDVADEVDREIGIISRGSLGKVIA